MKRCTKCKEIKSLDMFHKWIAGKDGRQCSCKLCMLEAKRVWRLNNIEVARARKRKYDDENKEAISERRKQKYWENPEKHREEVLRLRRINPAKYRAIGSGTDGRRRALMINAVPKWADKLKIKDIYQKVSMMNLLEKGKYSVDHIVPLQSKIVCGLHNEFNLQILGMSENTSKGNKYWPDMPQGESY